MVTSQFDMNAIYREVETFLAELDCVETGLWDVYNKGRFELTNETDTVNKGVCRSNEPDSIFI